MNFERPKVYLIIDGEKYDLNKAEFVVKTVKPGSSEANEKPIRDKSRPPVKSASLNAIITS